MTMIPIRDGTEIIELLSRSDGEYVFRIGTARGVDLDREGLQIFEGAATNFLRGPTTEMTIPSRHPTDVVKLHSSTHGACALRVGNGDWHHLSRSDLEALHDAVAQLLAGGRLRSG